MTIIKFGSGDFQSVEVVVPQYGRLVLESLPQCTVRQGPLANLPREAGKWLGG